MTKVTVVKDLKINREIILDYSGGSNVITSILKDRGRRMREKSGRESRALMRSMDGSIDRSLARVHEA